jgi:hypothetical protein
MVCCAMLVQPLLEGEICRYHECSRLTPYSTLPKILTNQLLLQLLCKNAL